MKDFRIVLLMAFTTLAAVEIFFSANQRFHFLPPFRPRSAKVVSPRNVWAMAQGLGLKPAPESIVRPPNKILEKLTGQDLDYSSQTVPDNSYVHGATGKVRVTVKKTGEEIYHAQYTCTPEGRRVTPTNPNASQFLLTLGDSYTFGEGVEDDQNYPARLAQLLPSFQVYNMGRPGFGVNDHLFQSSQFDSLYFEGVREKEGIVVYTVTPALMFRLILGSGSLAAEHNIRPNYELDPLNEALILRGKFSEANRYKLFFLNLWASSATLRYFELYWPLKYSADDYLLFAKVMNGIRFNLMQKYKIQHFYVALWQHSPPNMVEGLYPELTRLGFEVLDYSSIEFRNFTKGAERIPADQHPSPEVYWFYAQMLAKSLI